MIAEIRRHLEARPFTPFAVRMTDGREYPVPTLDHIYVTPRGNRVVISDDEGIVVVLPALHISGIVERSNGNGGPGH